MQQKQIHHKKDKDTDKAVDILSFKQMHQVWMKQWWGFRPLDQIKSSEQEWWVITVVPDECRTLEANPWPSVLWSRALPINHDDWPRFSLEVIS